MPALPMLLAIAFLQPAEPAPRQAIEATLADISRAVLAADTPALLTHIAPDDPMFVMEWRHWGQALADAKPQEFSLAIGEGPSTFDQDRAEFPLVMSWLITSGPKESWGAGGVKRTVTWPPVVFTKAPAADGHAARWVFRGEKWERLKGDGFVVCYLPGSEEVAKDVAEAFPVARDHDNEGFQVKPPPQTLKLFTSMDHLKATVYLSMPDSYLGGWSEPGEAIKFMTNYTRGVRGWTAAYAHEYGHVCNWSLSENFVHGPWWVEEGAAELAAQEYRPGYWARLDSAMRRDAKDGKLTPWEDITDYMNATQSVKQRAYTQGNHMVGYISQKWGREGRNAWLRAMAAGATLDEATRKTLGRPFAQLDEEWRKELATPLPEPQEKAK